MVDSKVLIAIPTAEYARRADFYDFLGLLEKPEGSYQLSSHGQSPAAGRNVAIKYALENDFTHILFIDDDTAFASDSLMKLLARDVDIVTGLYLMRNYPHRPIIFDVALDSGECAWHYLKSGETGLVPIVATGLGFCLIKTSVFSKLEAPYIRLGQCDPENWCDDIDFFNRCRKSGVELFCDLDVHIGHIASMILWPVYHEGNWYTTYDTKGTGAVTIPTAKQEVKND